MTPKQPAAAPTLFIIDPVLVNLSGHVFNLHAGLARRALARGWRARAVLPRDIEDERIITALDPIRALDSIHVKRFPRPDIEIGAANHQFRLDLELEVTPLVSPSDICLFPAVLHRNLYGLMAWWDACPTPPRLALVLWSQQCFDTKDVQRNRGFYNDLLAWASERQERVSLYAFAPEHARFLEELCGREVAVRPFPLHGFTWNLGETPSRRDIPTQKPPVLGYLGNSWWPDKGLEQMIGAIQIILRQGADARFLVQLDLRFTPAETAARWRAAAAALPTAAVELIEGALDADAYAAALRRCDAVVLPYGPGYDHQTSGILFEALALGKPVATRAESMPARELERLGISQPLFGPWSAEAVAGACQSLLANFDEHQRESSRISETVRTSLSLDRFLDDLGVCDLAPAPPLP